MQFFRLAVGVAGVSLLIGCVDPTALQPSATPEETPPISAADPMAEDAAHDNAAVVPDSPQPMEADVAGPAGNHLWMAEAEPMSDEEFAADWPRVIGTWHAVRIDKFLIKDGAVTRLDSKAIPPQFITTVIDDETWTTTRRRRGQSETESAGTADLHQRVRDRQVALSGDKLYVLMIDANVNGGTASEKHFTVFARE